MKKLILIPLFLLCVTAFGQWTKPQLYNNINTNIRLKTYSPTRVAAVLDSLVKSMGLVSGGMIYPSLGIARSTGSAWATSITDNSANWNTAFGWGNHASAGYQTPLTFSNGLTEAAGAVRVGGTLTTSISFPASGTQNFVIGSSTIANAVNNFEAWADNTVRIQAGNIISPPNSYLDMNTTNAYLNFYDGTSSSFFLVQSGLAVMSDGASQNFTVNRGVGVILNLSSDATGDTYYRNSSGYFTRLPVGTNGHVLTLSGGLPSWAAASGGFSDPMTTRGDIIFRNASNTTDRLGAGTVGQVLTSDGTDISWAAAAGGASLSGLTAATGTNTINNAAHAQEWQWNTLGAGTGLTLSSSSTAAASNTNTVFRVNQTGANATSTQTTTSVSISNTKTGTSSTNVALDLTASGGTTNLALRTAGDVNITGSGLTSSTNNFIASSLGGSQGIRLRGDGELFLGLNNWLQVGNGQRYIYRGLNQTGIFTVCNDGSIGGRIDLYGTSHATRPSNIDVVTPLFSVHNSMIVGGTTLTTNALLDLQSTTQAFIPPRMTTAQRDAIGTPSVGMTVYNSTTNLLNFYNGTTWSGLTEKALTITNNDNLGTGNIQWISGSDTGKSFETYFSANVSGSWNGANTSTNILNTVPDNSTIVVTFTFTGVQTSGTPGSSGFHYKVTRAFRRTTTTTTAIGAAEIISSSNDTGDTFAVVPTVSTSGSNINFDRSLTTAKTFNVSLKIEVDITD